VTMRSPETPWSGWLVVCLGEGVAGPVFAVRSHILSMRNMVRVCRWLVIRLCRQQVKKRVPENCPPCSQYPDLGRS
jgi:hypothetical protein